VKLVEDVRRVCGPLTDTCGHSRTLDPKSWTVAGHSRSVGGHSRTLAENCPVRGCVEITGNSGGEVIGVSPTLTGLEFIIINSILRLVLIGSVLPHLRPVFVSCSLLRPLAPRDNCLHLFGHVILRCIPLQPSRPVGGAGASFMDVIIITSLFCIMLVCPVLPKRRALDAVRPGA
jgi:hypothetical protein